MLSLLFSQTFREEQNRFPRVSQARENKETYLDSLLHSKGIDYPPYNILIVAYKHEQILELWARPETTNTFTLIKQYPFTAYCGTLGPKRKQGDMQIPEGFYTITHFNPHSNFHLSMLVSYPNKSDRIQSPFNNPGGEIRIHGSYVTIGCIPIGDDAIEELYITCVDTRSGGQTHIPVYIFPTRMNSTGMNMLQKLMQDNASLRSFWFDLKQGYDTFIVTRSALDYDINDTGQYVFKNQLFKYFWLAEYTTTDRLLDRILLPDGFYRTLASSVSFSSWLRHLPLKPGNPAVRLYNGALKSYQGGHAAVIDIPIGNKDLQQCADAIMRLYAEFNYSIKAYDAIAFRITNGDKVSFRTWINGSRPYLSGSVIAWDRTAAVDSSYAALTGYLEFIYAYAGSYSLSQQLNTVSDIDSMDIGDIFIQGGFPGHAVIVVDMAEHPVTKERVFLLAQSYMPAQDIHILNNLDEPALSPWYRLAFGDTLYTPEWTFTKNDLKRF
ncbi:hypothetical protein JXB22_09720 [candidate division WOR-3 bacterium]|nr:hypothetical protein [candidate division WOR-3 bacterium]